MGPERAADAGENLGHRIETDAANEMDGNRHDAPPGASIADRNG
jgi:hypothetical protein